MLEFGALPPEVNSGWMYTGPGSAPMMTASAAWHALAAELASTAAACQAVISQLAGEQWTGPASVSMAAAAARYVAWMSATAAQAEQAADQATAAAAAFETAFAMTVPPPMIAANRSLLMALVTTNFLGQNTPAIAATEAHYAEMWAQDATAMYGYAGGSAAAAQVTPFTGPGQTTNPGGAAGQAAAVVQAAGASAAGHPEIAQLISAMPAGLQNLASPLQGGRGPSATDLSGMLSGLLNTGDLTGNVNGMVNAGAWNVASTLSTALGFLSSMGGKGGTTMGSALTGSLGPAVGTLGSAVPASLTGGAAVSAGLGQAGSVGALSVPTSWAASAPAGAAAAALPSAGANAVTESGLTPLPAGMPVGGVGGRAGSGVAVPRYGFKPTVVAHPVMAG